eukprot:4913184-Amphidinium_carterae.2
MAHTRVSHCERGSHIRRWSIPFIRARKRNVSTAILLTTTKKLSHCEPKCTTMFCNSWLRSVRQLAKAVNNLCALVPCLCPDSGFQCEQRLG